MISENPIINAAVVVQPGDILIVGIGISLTAEQNARTAKMLGDEMPQVRVCVMDCVSAMAVVKAAATVPVTQSDQS